MLTIPKSSKKPCDICMQGEAVEARFNDGFTGSVCWRCLQRMFKARTNGKENHAEAKTSSSAAQL